MRKGGARTWRERRVVVAVTGGIAAYKACGIVSRLVQQGAGVRVIMTAGAARLVRPLSFATLSGHPVADPFDREDGPRGLEHIDLATWGEVLLVAPCTANTLSKIALGIADEPVTTLSLAFRGPQLLVPAMNTAMWTKPVIGRHVESLRGDGYHVLQPDSGRLACGEAGEGRMPEEGRILEELLRFLP